MIPDVPPDHKPGMRVPKGGSSCASCEYLREDRKTCESEYFIKWHGSNVIPAPIDEYCSDWYEPAKKDDQPSAQKPRSISAPLQVLLVRHAPTTANDPSTEAIRGHSDIPVSIDGMQHLRQTAKFLKKSGFPIRHILSSPLQRAMMSADIIAQEVSAKITPTFGLTPWDLGDLTGRSIKEAAPQMNKHQHHPDMKVPNGESYRDFYNRWTDGLERMLQYAEAHPDENLVGVVHSRNMLSLPSILGSRNIGDVPIKGGPPPGAVVKVYKEDDDWKYQVIFKQDL